MPTLSTWAVYSAAVMALLVVPGPAVLYVVTRSIDQGRLAGIVSVLGVSLGALVHIAAAAVGVSAILMTSALAFNLVKYLGAAYLIYLGVQKLLEKDTPLEEIDTSQAPDKLSRVFYQGAIVNILNPKSALFFFAFLPQFVDPTLSSVAGQIWLFGAAFVAMAILSDGTYALLAGTLGKWLKSNRGFLRAQRYFAGTIYIALGITTALSGNSNSK